MTASEAILEARRRWGEAAGITNVWDSAALCAVGRFTQGRFVILGRGSSWDDAFDAADPERRVVRIRGQQAADRRRRG